MMIALVISLVLVWILISLLGYSLCVSAARADKQMEIDMAERINQDGEW